MRRNPGRAAGIVRVGAVVAALALAPACAEEEPVEPPPVEADEEVGGTGGASAERLAAQSQACLDAVRGELYVQAVEACERALRDGAGTDVEQALREARAALSREATGAAARAATDALEGENVGEAAKKAGRDALRNLRGGSAEEDAATAPDATEAR